jgi:predicted nucleotidyltransferase
MRHKRGTHRHNSEEKRLIAEHGTILRCLVGSGVHGTSVSGTDDRDEMGICIEPPEYVIGLKDFEQFEYHTAWEREGGYSNRSGPGDLDVNVYSLRKWMRLALNGNPSILIPLFVPENALVKQTVLGRELQELAPKIISKLAGARYLGYLHAQRRSMLSREGKGRDVTRPELVEKYGYDTKYAGHMIRLGIQGIELMDTGRLMLPMAAGDIEFVKEVRTGKHSMEAVLEETRTLESNLKDAIDASPLPDEPDRDYIDHWLAFAYHFAWEDDNYFGLARAEDLRR